jgi:hypothetical protein
MPAKVITIKITAASIELTAFWFRSKADPHDKMFSKVYKG